VTPGTATITATSNGKTGTATVTVNSKIVTFYDNAPIIERSADLRRPGTGTFTATLDTTTNQFTYDTRSTV
jgi:hypothetical protein